MSNEWEKQWEWNDNAPMYTDRSWLENFKGFPIFWYYCLADGEIWYIKQISKFCGVVHDQNYFGPKREKSAVARLAIRSVQKFTEKELADYHTMKSWSTLGEQPDDSMPLSEYVVRPNGGGYMMKFHPVTRKWIQKIHVDENGEIEYRAKMLVKTKKNNLGVWHEEIEYSNSLGDHYQKHWNENKQKTEWKKI